MKTLIVGDVHGCRSELEALIARCGLDPVADRLVLVGDLVAKGPDSKGVVELARGWGAGADAVRGNHDEHVLRWRRAVRAGEPPPKLRPAHQGVVDALEEDDWAYLEALPLWRRYEGLLPDRDVLVVHAGLDPATPLDAQEPANLMNMRSIADDGTVSKRVEGGAPWASRWPGPELVVFGHDALRGLQEHPHALGLDTGCCYGGRLSGALFERGEMRLEQVRAAAVYTPPGGKQ
ncbi:MAG TPA: metallophosphoesterase [Polyangiaceae bacterium LLY-WYZ-15_(1-7)]|nr:metallophosphatase [Myxococcales bacterium]MAT29415.1 metallophosphatase [Sandaracinus sp.]HJL01919.1 metallophosphoesterase [Polyangiaceae bacterium LLY-WYZ-15_(1-7)]MBJ70769.1 metallophosphatase [Sandaracinus sp.]HJL09548.1 metallophosphoesterase [Polyangiaceae bacterium LLY-WYZ-15_(1-7)]